MMDDDTEYLPEEHLEEDSEDSNNYKEESEEESEEAFASESSTGEVTFITQVKRNAQSKTSPHLSSTGKNSIQKKPNILKRSPSAHTGTPINKKSRTSDSYKSSELPVPAHINQYGDCLKTRLGKCHYGFTLFDPPCSFFRGVLKGASGQTLAVMFSDLNLLERCKKLPKEDIGNLMIDTTFNVTPNGTEGVNKIVTITMFHKKLVLPLWYAITSCSSTELYKRILIEFQQHVMDLSLKSVFMDNDPALGKAVRTVFPEAAIYGSWFHYCRSIWKELQNNGLSEECKVENSALLEAVKLLMVVPYLPPPSLTNFPSPSMVEGFEYVRELATETNLPVEFNSVLNFVALFWFNKVTPECFTMYGKHTDTLNYAETLYLLLLSYTNENANVWDLTRSIQYLARRAHGDLLRLGKGTRLVARKTSGRKFNVPIRMNMKKLKEGSMDVKTFLEKSTIYLGEMLNIFLHPLYPNTVEKTNYTHTEGWELRFITN